MVTLEEENKRLNERLDEKDKIIEELKGKIDSAERKETREPHVQPKSRSSFFDNKKSHVKNTESELIMMTQIREEIRARKAKEKNIVLSGMREGTSVYETENEADD